MTERDPTEPERRAELANFLRAHRARILPAQLGLPARARRRTPGLRREEVAELIGVGVTWYTWLEQGRDIAASPPALSALARALQLTPAERAYLFELADRRDPNLSGRAGEESQVIGHDRHLVPHDRAERLAHVLGLDPPDLLGVRVDRVRELEHHRLTFAYHAR